MKKMATCGAQRSKEKMKGGWRSAAKQRENDKRKNKLDEAGEPEPEPEPDLDGTIFRVICEPYLHVRTDPRVGSRIVGRLFPGAQLWVANAGIQKPNINDNIWVCFADLWAAVRYNGVTLMEVVE